MGVALVLVAEELVGALLYSISQTLLSMLVKDAFHQGVAEHFISFAHLRELVAGCCHVAARVSNRVMLEGKFAVSCGDLLAVGVSRNFEDVVELGVGHI